MLRSNNLLTKSKALARSIELQRREGLIKHISAVKLRAEIEQMDKVVDKGDEELYNKLDEKEDDAFPDTYAQGEDGEILAQVEPSEIDDVDWDSETEFGDDTDLTQNKIKRCTS
ncbi:hypothetical protein AALP_AA1G047000 [Arabis alpina]|uniref:Uncharacterized protein n=1 Tax=Arabis alpina TaxID=50452 RepID=A0A087HL45_ARAAL|nr:hypothetical protein AALP_AA1G047000 [Arabis alpina]